MTPIIQHDPRETERLLGEIEALLDRGEPQKALALAEGALAAGRVAADAREALLWKKELALFRLGRYGEALGTLELLRPRRGETGPWLREMSLVFYAMSRAERPPEEATLLLLLAEEAFEGSCQGEPGQRELDFLEEIRGGLYRRERCGQIVNAIDRLPEEQRTPRNLQQAALALCELGEFDRALKTLEEIPGERDPRHWYTLGYILYHRAYGESGSPDLSAAREQLLRCMAEKPSPLLALECRSFLEGIEKNIYQARLGGNDRSDREPLRYRAEEWDAVGAHIQKRFGPSGLSLRRQSQIGLELDLPLIPPSGERKGFLVCTQGLGAVVMDPPGGEQDRDLRRAELFFTAAPGWDPAGGDPQKLWPAAALPELAKFPLNDPKAWLGPGRIFELPEDALPTGQRFALILPPAAPYEDADPCILPGGEPVRFCQVLFLYREEAGLVVDRGLDALWDRLGGESYLVDPERRNACEG